MIISFGNKDTEKLFITGKSNKYPQTIIRTALRKLDYINAANDRQSTLSVKYLGHLLQILYHNSDCHEAYKSITLHARRSETIDIYFVFPQTQ